MKKFQILEIWNKTYSSDEKEIQKEYKIRIWTLNQHISKRTIDKIMDKKMEEYKEQKWTIHC